MNKIEKFLYRIGKSFSSGNIFESEEERYEVDKTLYYKQNPVFTSKKLDGHTIKDIIQTIDENCLDVKRFGCSETTITICRNTKIIPVLEGKPNETIPLVKIKEEMDARTGYKYLKTRYIFYTFDIDRTPIKISITTFCEYDDHDDENMREACFVINAYFAQGVVRISKINEILFNPNGIKISLDCKGLDVISTKKTSGYMSVLGDKKTYFNSGIEKDEPRRTFDGHFDDVLPYHNTETIDLSDYDAEEESNVISLTDVIRKRKKQGVY